MIPCKPEAQASEVIAAQPHSLAGAPGPSDWSAQAYSGERAAWHPILT